MHRVLRLFPRPQRKLTFSKHTVVHTMESQFQVGCKLSNPYTECPKFARFRSPISVAKTQSRSMRQYYTHRRTMRSGETGQRLSLTRRRRCTISFENVSAADFPRTKCCRITNRALSRRGVRQRCHALC